MLEKLIKEDYQATHLKIITLSIEILEKHNQLL